MECKESEGAKLTAVKIRPTAVTLLSFLTIKARLGVRCPKGNGYIMPMSSVRKPAMGLGGKSMLVLSSIGGTHRMGGSIIRVLFLKSVLITFKRFLEGGRPLCPSK